MDGALATTLHHQKKSIKNYGNFYNRTKLDGAPAKTLHQRSNIYYIAQEIKGEQKEKKTDIVFLLQLNFIDKFEEMKYYVMESNLKRIDFAFYRV